MSMEQRVDSRPRTAWVMNPVDVLDSYLTFDLEDSGRSFAAVFHNRGLPSIAGAANRLYGIPNVGHNRTGHAEGNGLHQSSKTFAVKGVESDCRGHFQKQVPIAGLATAAGYGSWTDGFGEEDMTGYVAAVSMTAGDGLSSIRCRLRIDFPLPGGKILDAEIQASVPLV